MESGTSQVYITPSDGRGGKRLITDEGGGYLPVWGPDDVEVYYTSADRLMAARVDTTSAAPARERRTVIESFPARQLGYDVHSGDGSIVFVRPAAPDDDVRWILGWVTELPEAIRR